MKPTFPVVAVATLVLAACSNHVMDSSGHDYLSRYDAQVQVGGKASVRAGSAGEKTGEDRFRQAAAVEPLLETPARIGLARIYRGVITFVPMQETEGWQALAKKHGGKAEFMPISPALAEFTAQSVGMPRSGDWRARTGDLIQTIRLGAARQHLDAVLIYEIGAYAKKETTWLAIADLTLIGGAILPTREITAFGQGSALLLDVRNGYAYGFANAQKDLTNVWASWGSDAATDDMRESAAAAAVEALQSEVDEMLVTVLKKAEARKAKRLARASPEPKPAG